MLNIVINMIFGKVDTDPLYEGMSDWNRRNADKRKAFVRDKLIKYSAEKDRLDFEYKDKKAKGLSFDQILTEYYATVITETLYDKAQSLRGPSAEHARKFALETILKQMEADFVPSHPLWLKGVEIAGENAVVRQHLPGLFDGTTAVVWEQIVADRRAEAERRRLAEEAKKAKEAQERQRRTELREILGKLEAERSRLQSMFSSMGSGMNRTQVVVAIDALDSRISRLREELR